MIKLNRFFGHVIDGPVWIRLIFSQTIDRLKPFERHEAFAATSIKCQRDLDISHDELNVNGGCIALGHPMGATGGIMMGTLIDELERRQLKIGIIAASSAALLIECL